VALYGNRTRYKTGKKHKTIIRSSKPVKNVVADVDKNIANAVAIHTVVNSRTATSVLTTVNDYQNPDLNNRTTVVNLSRQLRSIEGICASVADLLADFGVTKGAYYSDSEELKLMLNKWANFVNGPIALSKQKGVVFPVPGIRSLSRKIFDDYITDGDAVFTLFWKNGVKMDPNDTESYFIPVSIKTLDTASLTIDPDLASLGVERIELKFSNDTLKRIKEPTTDADKFLRDSLPKEWLKFINSGESIILDANVTYHLKRNGKDWKAWGEPLFLKAFSAVAAKRRLQAVDDATIDGLINRFTVFKLGLEDKDKNPAYHIPSNARTQALIEILTSSKRTNAIVWPGPDLDIMDIGPDGKILEFDQKYKQADIDILRALHVSPLLIDGGSTGQSARDWAAFVSTEVGLDAIRNELEQTFTQIGKEIALANKMDYEQLYYKFDTQMLKDEKAVRDFALKVFELGGLSVETFVRTMGYDFNTEKTLKEREQSSGVSDLFVNPNVPGFTGKTPDGGDGRPPGSTDDEPREDKDKSAASNPLDNVTVFYGMYKRTFDSVIKNVNYHLAINQKNMATMTLIAGFNQFKLLVDSQLNNTFLKYSGGNVTGYLEKLLQWNENYITRFYQQAATALETSQEDFNLLAKKSDERILMYAQESFRKAKWVGLMALAKLEGKTKAIWSCDNPQNITCVENNGKSFDLDILVGMFPSHPNCKCTLEFM